MTATPANISGFPGQTTSPITVNLTFGATRAGGTGTIIDAGTPPGTSTVPAPITYPFASGATSATTTFQFAIGAATLPGIYNVDLRDGTNSAGLTTVILVVNNPSMTPSAAPNPVTLTVGGPSQPVTVSTTTDPGFNARITYAFTGLPAFINSGAPQSVSPPYSPISFNFSLGAGAAGGTYSGSLTGSYTDAAGTPQSRAIPFTVVVQQPDIAARFSSPSVAVCNGGAAVSDTIELSPVNGYSGTPLLSFSAPPGIVVSPAAPTSGRIPPNQSIPFTVRAAGASGTQTVTLNITDPAVGVNRSITLIVTVSQPDFTPAIAPNVVNLTAGGGGQTTIASIVPNTCFSATSVSITFSGQPAGITFNPSTPAIAGPAYTPVGIVMQAAASVASGTYSVTVTFTPSTGTAKSALLQINVAAQPDFRLDVIPSAVTLAPGQTTSVTVSATGINGFASPITVRAPSSPDLTFTPSTFTITPGVSQQVTIASNGSALPATFNGVFEGAAAGITGTRSAPIAVTITPAPDFTLAVLPSSITVAQGSSATVSVVANALNGFNAPVTVTTNSGPVGVSPSTFILTPGVPQNVTITATTTTPTGPSSVTFTGSSASVNAPRSATLTVDVSARADFSLTVAPPALTIQSGGSATAVVTVASLNGFSGQVAITGTGPAGVTLTPSSFSLAAGATQTVRIDVARGTAAGGPLTIRFTGAASGLTHTADLLLTILSPRPIITAIVPPGVATATRSLVLRVSGDFFQNAASFSVGNPGVTVEKVAILTPNLADVTLSVRDDAAPGGTSLTLTNPDGGSATSTLLIFPAGSIAAPLSVTTAAIVYPPQGTMIAGHEAIYPRGLLATTGTGTIIGVWRFDGVPFDRFTVTVGGGYPAEIRAHVPIPISFAGGHTLELGVESPQYALSPAVEVVMAASNVARLAIFAPRDGAVILRDPPLFRWSLAPNSSGYVLEFDNGTALPQLPMQIRLSDPEWQPTPDALRRLGAGLHRWRVRAVFPGETEGEPTEWRRVAILPDHVDLVVTRPTADPRTGRLVVRWSGGMTGLLYRVEVLAPNGNTIFSALTARSEYALPSPLPAGSTVRVTALVPGGTAIGTSNPVNVATTSLPAGRFLLAQAQPVVTSKQPPDGATVTTPQPRIEARWSGSVRPDEVSLILDQTDVTNVASISAGSVTYDSLLPLAAGQHTVRLGLPDGVTTWSFMVAEAAPTPEAAAKTGETPEKKEKAARGTLRTDWAINPVGTLTIIKGDGPNEKDDARLQLSTQTDLSNDATGAKATGNISFKHDLDDPNKTLQESRNWLTQFNAHQGPFKEEAKIGYAAPGFVDQSELLTTGLARGGVEGRLHLPFAVASYYQTFGTRPAGVVAGNFGPEQTIRAAALQSPVNAKWDVRLIGMRVTDEPGFNSAGGTGEAYGIFGKYILNSMLSIIGEIAHGSFDPNPASAESSREGSALRLGFSGARGTLSYTINFRRTDSDFINPANRGFTPGGVPDRTGVNVSVTKLVGRTSIGIQLRQLKDGNSSTAILPKNRENGGVVSLNTAFGTRVSLSLSGNWTGDRGQANPTLFLPKLDRRQSGGSGTLAESFGRFSLSQTISYQELSDGVNPFSNQKMTSGTLTASGALAKNLNIAAILSGTRSEGSSLVGTNDQILASLQPSLTIPALSVTLQPRAMYSRSKSDLTNQESKGEQYQALLSWAPPWMQSGLSFQLSADSNRNRSSFQPAAPFVRRYAGTFSLKWGAGSTPAAPATPVINPPADTAAAPSKDPSTTSSISQ